MRWCVTMTTPDFTCIGEVTQGAAEGASLQTFTDGVAVVEACSAQVAVACIFL